MTKAFQHIGLITRLMDDKLEVIRSGLVSYLDENHLTHVHGVVTPDRAADDNLARSLETCDLVIVLGGDGTLLASARLLASLDKPLLCVNLGRLGFLASVSPYEMFEALDEILHGRFIEERRMMLRGEILDEDGTILARGVALNEVSLHRWAGLRMVEFETSVDGRFLNQQRADGLIVATPTGSTAYALSCGGPIVYPTLESLVLVPVSPHAMGIRPMTLPGSSQVEITVSPENREAGRVTFDGQGNHVLETHHRVIIRRHEQGIRLIHPVEYDYFEILRAKLNWGR
ncbi:MAG: NAD(+)/NADH kinase [Pseudomonadota bacterium]|nr:NAD(+)/NADH kinase [Pseudomonadota bacterium]